VQARAGSTPALGTASQEIERLYFLD
jgi:hypothetical protein